MSFTNGKGNTPDKDSDKTEEKLLGDDNGSTKIELLGDDYSGPVISDHYLRYNSPIT